MVTPVGARLAREDGITGDEDLTIFEIDVGRHKLTQDRIKTKLGRIHPAETFIMKLSSQIKPISYLKSHTAEIVKTITESREPLVITQNGEAKLVVMDVKSFEEQENTMALLKLLAMGNREIEDGKFRDAEDVFAELDKADHQ